MLYKYYITQYIIMRCTNSRGSCLFAIHRTNVISLSKETQRVSPEARRTAKHRRTILSVLFVSVLPPRYKAITVSSLALSPPPLRLM